MTDVSVRRLQYFVTVAEELNFGRAAALLHIAQPVLSRQIAVLERELGVTLFERSARGTALSAAGRTLLAEARAVLASADALQRRAALLARGGQRLAIGFMPGLIVSPLVQLLSGQFPGLDLEMVRTSWDDCGRSTRPSPGCVTSLSSVPAGSRSRPVPTTLPAIARSGTAWLGPGSESPPASMFTTA